MSVGDLVKGEDEIQSGVVATCRDVIGDTLQRRCALPGVGGAAPATLAAIGLSAAVDPGPGPRTVQGALSLGPLYLPPLLAGLLALALAALVTGHRRWPLVVGGLFAVVLLVGTVTLGAAAVSYRLTHPEAGIGFIEDILQVAGETLTVGATLAASVLWLCARERPRSPG